MRNFLKIITLFCGTLATSCTILSNQNSNQVILPSDSIVINHDYSEISDYKILWDEVFRQELNEYFVYFYSKTCIHCQNLKNWIIEKALQSKCIFFVESSKDDIIKNDAKRTFYLSSAEIFSIPGYPTLIKISNKNLMLKVSGEESIHAALNFLD